MAGMELADFDKGLGVGIGLSLEEKAVLEVEMAKRRVEEKLASIKFWGKLQGMLNDYIIVCGLTSVMEAPSKKFFFCTNKALALKQLPALSAEFQAEAAKLKGRFSGDPSKLLGKDADADPNAEEVDDEGNPKPKREFFSEAHRLAYAIAAIERDTAVVPAGAFCVTPTHYIVPDPSFVGLSATEAGDLAQFFHFRPAEQADRATALSRAAVVRGAQDWLDPCSEDKPKGVWALRVDAAAGQVALRSLKWPGYYFWHELATPRYGGVYFGDGQVNGDLQFML